MTFKIALTANPAADADNVMHIQDGADGLIGYAYAGPDVKCPDFGGAEVTGTLRIDRAGIYCTLMKQRFPDIAFYYESIEKIVRAAEEKGSDLVFTYEPDAIETGDSTSDKVFSAISHLGGDFEMSSGRGMIQVTWANDNEFAGDGVDLDIVVDALRDAGLRVEESWTRERKHWQRCNILVAA